MIKIFDYEYPKRGWVEIASYDEAVTHIEKTFHDYWLHDRDNCCNCYMEIYNDGDYEVWCGEFGSWSCEDDDAPYKIVYKGPREDFVGSLKFTALIPTKDYILI